MVDLEEHIPVMVALCLAGILGLLYIEMKKADKELNVGLGNADGFLTGGALANLAQKRSDSWRGDVGDPYKQRDFMGNAMEPPVFWNAGSYADVNKSQQDAASSDALYDVTNWGARLESDTAWMNQYDTGKENMAGKYYVERMGSSPATTVLGQNVAGALY